METDPSKNERLIFSDQAEAAGLFYDDTDPEFIDYDDVLIKEIFLGRQPFDVNPYSPTPLDPYHLTTAGSDYFTAATLLMSSRLDEVAQRVQLSDGLYDLIHDEIMSQHRHRSDKNNLAMRELRLAYENDKKIDKKTANRIIAARAALSNVADLARILAENPKMGGIEVMKFTKPFDTSDTLLAHAHFIHSMRMIDNTQRDFSIIGDIQTHNQHILANPNNDIGSHIVATKGKEADIMVNGHHVELMGRYSYVTLDPGLALSGVQSNIVHTGGKKVNVQPIAITKYLRMAQPSSGHSA